MHTVHQVPLFPALVVISTLSKVSTQRRVLRSGYRFPFEPPTGPDARFSGLDARPPYAVYKAGRLCPEVYVPHKSLRRPLDVLHLVPQQPSLTTAYLPNRPNL